MKLKLQLIRVGFLLLLLSAACSPVHRLGNDPGVLKWEKEVSVFDTMPVSTDQRTILFTGSSSIRLWKNIAQDIRPYQPLVRAYGGSKLSDYVYYCDRLAGKHAWSAVVVFIANDITGNAADLSPEDVLSLMRKTVRLLRKKHRNATVFWIETMPVPCRFHVWDKVSRANDLIRDYCDNRSNLIFIPTRDFILTGNGIPDTTLFLSDNLHLNTRGYALWTTRIRQYLDETVPELRLSE